MTVGLRLGVRTMQGGVPSALFALSLYGVFAMNLFIVIENVWTGCEFVPEVVDYDLTCEAADQLVDSLFATGRDAYSVPMAVHVPF